MSNVIPPEQWKQYDKDYWVSDQGRVKRVYKNGKEKYLATPKRSTDNNRRVKIHDESKSLSRVVWETFKGKLPDGYVLAHKNGCASMNDLYNLQPIKKGIASGLGGRARKKYVVNLDTGNVYLSTRLAAQYLHIGKSTVASYCNNRTKNPIYNLEYYDESKEYKRNLKFIRS